jgi:ParB-like chromosome segregation protein Spo0J
VTYPFHPLADAFPLIEGPEFEELVASVRDHGLFDPITLLEGSILDGRNRYRACQAAGVEPRFEEFDGGDPTAFVVSKNINRRHLNVSQRAMIAAKLATIPPHVNRKYHDAENSASSLTRSEAAALLNVSEDSVTFARTILAKGTPDEIAQVERGDASVHTVAKQIRDGVPVEARKPRTRDEAKRNNTKQINAEIWHQFKEATALLAGMPHAEDAVRIIRAHDKARIAPERLSTALQWLKDFSDEWNRINAEAA